MNHQNPPGVNQQIIVNHLHPQRVNPNPPLIRWARLVWIPWIPWIPRLTRLNHAHPLRLNSLNLPDTPDSAGSKSRMSFESAEFESLEPHWILSILLSVPKLIGYDSLTSHWIPLNYLSPLDLNLLNEFSPHDFPKKSNESFVSQSPESRKSSVLWVCHRFKTNRNPVGDHHFLNGPSRESPDSESLKSSWIKCPVREMSQACV